MDLPQIDDYRSLFLSDTPLLDVRAPVEFAQGAFPCADNLPLINDDERAVIGLRYKEIGHDDAVALGHELVKDDIKEQRVNHWQEFITQNPEGVLYCFRGGMRSKISQQWIFEKTGIIYPRVKGGYKAMRRFLIDELDKSANSIKPVMLGGRTGIGKTLLLKQINQQIDLEGIFHHRGSVFGKHVTPQPSQIDIENTLSIQLLQLTNRHGLNIVFEDEGTNIGSRRIPETLFKKMKQSPIILLEASVEERVHITFQEYIIEALDEHQSHFGTEKGLIVWAEQLHTSIDKIERRLGGVRHKELKKQLTNALQEQQLSNNIESHKEWIKILLVDYYDPMYDFQINKKEDRIVYKGEKEEVLEYLREHYQIT